MCVYWFIYCRIYTIYDCDGDDDVAVDDDDDDDDDSLAHAIGCMSDNVGALRSFVNKRISK